MSTLAPSKAFPGHADLRMKLRQFSEITAISDHGSIRAAARYMMIAQPVLTRSLAELERELGAPLFERRARGVVATPFGVAFVRRANLILQEVRRAREEVEQLKGATSGNVTVGLSIASHLSLLPSALRPFRERFPDVRLHIIEGFYPTLEFGLRDGAIDFYIGPDSGQNILPELSKEALFQGRRAILCRVDHPLASRRSLSDLRGADWITTSITAEAEDEIGIIFERYKLPPPKLSLRSQSALTLMICLANSDLLAMVPMQWTEFAPFKGFLTSIEVREELAAPPIVLVKRADLPLTPAATHLLDLMRRAQLRLPTRVGA
jgi:LysR family transcriptional regulator of abg operon